jgi:hypothetical protein
MLNQLRHIGTLLLVSTLALPTALSGQSAQAVEEILQTSVALTGDAAVLDLELASGRSLQIMFNDGLVLIDGDVVGRYAPGGALESAWRDLLRGASLGELGSGWRGEPGRAGEQLGGVLRCRVPERRRRGG